MAFVCPLALGGCGALKFTVEIDRYMDVEPKIGGFYPQNGCFFFHGKTLLKWMIWGGFPIIFGNTHILKGNI